MEERDRNYLARLEREKQAMQKQRQQSKLLPTPSPTHKKEVKMKTQTYGLSLPVPVIWPSTHPAGRAVFDARVAAREDYKEKRSNGNEYDSPKRAMPEDGRFSRTEENCKPRYFRARYDQGPSDRAWMEERDRNYLERIKKEDSDRQQEEEKAKGRTAARNTVPKRKPKVKAAPKKSLARMRCTENYPNEGDETYLDLHEGDLIEITESYDDDWYVARLKGKEGFAPKNLLEPASKISTSGASSSPDVSFSHSQSSGSGSNPPPQNSRQSQTQEHSPSQGAAGNQPRTLSFDAQFETLDDKVTLDSDKPMGSGAFAQVYAGVYYGSKVAVKCLKHVDETDKEHQKALTNFKRESAVWLSLRHDRIVQLFRIGLITLKGYPRFTMVMKRMAYTLSEVVHNGENRFPNFPNERRRQIAADILGGLQYLHGEKYLHLDLKSDNVLLDESYRAQLADFGLSRTLESVAKSTGVRGTYTHIAPEIMEAKAGCYRPPCDIYSYAIVVWEIATRAKPFANLDACQLTHKVTNQRGRPELSNTCPAELKQYLADCWHPSPSQRLTATQALEQLPRKEAFCNQVATTSAATANTNNDNFDDGWGHAAYSVQS